MAVDPDTRAKTREEAAREVLWCLHVTGMDDVHPAPDRATAQLWAAQWTIWNQRKSPIPHAFDPVVNWTVGTWPWDAQSHAAGLEKSIANNTFPVDPLAYASLTHPSSGEDMVLIWSGEHQAYWRPNGNGYTVRMGRVGLFPQPEAEKILRGVGPEKKLEIEPLPDAITRTNHQSIGSDRSNELEGSVLVPRKLTRPMIEVLFWSGSTPSEIVGMWEKFVTDFALPTAIPNNDAGDA